MVRVLLATNIREIDDGIREISAGRIEICGEVYYAGAVPEAAEGADVVVLSAAAGEEKEIEELLYRLRCMDKRVIFLPGDEKNGTVNTALALGIYDILFDPVKPEDVVGVIERPMKFSDVSGLIAKGKRTAAAREVSVERVVVKEVKRVARQQTISWWSADGGVGKTTLAVMQAVLLFRKTGEDVALLDFKEVTPHIHKVMGLQRMDLDRVYDAVERGEVSPAVIKGCMQKKQGVWVLTGVSLRDFERFKEKHFDGIIRSLQQEFPYLVIDTNPGIFFASTLAALKNSDIINTVLVPRMGSLEDTAMLVDFVCERWGINRERIRAVVNMAGFNGPDAETAERVLGVSTGAVRYSPKIRASMDGGKLHIPGEAVPVLLKHVDYIEKPGRGIIKTIAGMVRKDVADKPV